MKRLIPLLILLLIIPGCWNDRHQLVMESSGNWWEPADTLSFPLLVDSGTKIVYQFGHLTPDKGLKLYFDTIPNPPGGLKMDETVRRRLSANSE